MRAELGLPSVRGDDEKGGGMMGGFGGSMGGVGAGGKAKRPISVKFEIPYFTTSGIQVRYLKIIEPKVSQHDQESCNSAKMNTDLLYSCNTRPCLGCDTSHRVVTSQCVCRMCSNSRSRRISRLRIVTGMAWCLFSMATAYRRVGEFSEDLKGHHDDSAPGAVIITETRLETPK